MTDILIDIQNKTHRGTLSPTIEDFSLTLHAGEFVCLVGPSGCGKTTLLNSIAGLDRDYVGNIHLSNTQNLPKIGYVFQRPCLLPWRTVSENIELVLTTHTAGQKAYVAHLLALMQLTHYAHAYPKQLSEGMQRRVSIIRAFAIHPDLLLMDEPFVSLDAPMAREVRLLLENLWQKRPHTVLFVTHDLREAIALADKLVFLTQRPMRVLREISVTVARHLRQDTQHIDAFRAQLIANYPELQAFV